MASVCLFVMFYPHFLLHHEVEACDVFCDHGHDHEYLNGEVDEDEDKSFNRMMRDEIEHDKLIMTAMMIMTMSMMLTNLTTDLSHPKANSAPLSIGPHVFHTIHCTIIYIQSCA